MSVIQTLNLYWNVTATLAPVPVEDDEARDLGDDVASEVR